MQWIKFILFGCLSFAVMMNVWAININTDIPDFEFDSALPPDYYYSDDEMKNVERLMLHEMADEEPMSFNEKELRIRDALLRVTQDARNRRTISEVIPILRSMSKQQRLALAALVTAQTSARSGDEELNLKQAEAMFGERKDLILPLIFDIANIVKDISHGKNYDNDNINDGDVSFVDDNGTNEGRARRKGRSVRLREYGDGKSYHEWKLNMTDFRGTREANDQQAIESETQVRVALPHATVTSLPLATSTMSLEEIENLAFADLNGTSLPGVTNGITNGTDNENLPEPEMLIRPVRLRPRPIAERFDNLYLYVSDYPLKKIMASIRRHHYAMTALLADNPDEWKGHLEEMEAKKRREDDGDSQPTSGMCPSIVRYARPQKAKSSSGEWKYIVNTGQHTQTLRLEKCSSAEQSCTYLTDNFSSHCAQVYNYHRLLSWDSIRGLHIDIFKVPTCCSCQIDGYREKFPPIIESQSQNVYTVSSDSGADYSDNEDVVQYAPTISTAKKHRYVKRKKLKRTNSANLDTYLSPPSHLNEYNGADTFKRKHISVSLANRASGRKNNKADAVLVDNDESASTAEDEFIASPTIHHSIDRPAHILSKPSNVHLPRLVSQPKVLIKRVNYNYHPIIDFFFRERALKAAKAKENRIGHTSVIS